MPAKLFGAAFNVECPLLCLLGVESCLYAFKQQFVLEHFRICNELTRRYSDKLIEKIESGEESFDFVEIMACPNGCIGGGGQPPADNARKRERFKAIFRELRDEGRAVLISTHMIESVEDYWDVAHIMMNGRFAATKRNTPEDTASQSLEDLFFEITEGGERA